MARASIATTTQSTNPLPSPTSTTMPTWADNPEARTQPASQIARDFMCLANIGVAIWPHVLEPTKRIWKYMEERDKRIQSGQRERWARKAEKEERRRRRESY